MANCRPSASVSLSTESNGESSLRASTSATIFSPARPSKRNTSQSPGLSMRPLTMIGSVTCWALAGSLFGSCSRHSGSESTAKGTLVGNQLAPLRTESGRIPGSLSLASIVNFMRREIPTLQFDGGLRAGRAAQRKNARHKRQLAQRRCDRRNPRGRGRASRGFRARIRRPWESCNTEPDRDGNGSGRRTPVRSRWNRKSPRRLETSRERRRPDTGSIPAH